MGPTEKADILKIVSTDDAEGVEMSGTLNVNQGATVGGTLEVTGATTLMELLTPTTQEPVYL